MKRNDFCIIFSAWNHGHIDLAILFWMEFCHLGGKKRKRKRKRKEGSAHFTLGFFWEKSPKLPDFEGKKNLKLPNLDNARLAGFLNFSTFLSFGWSSDHLKIFIYLFIIIIFSNFMVLKVWWYFFLFLAICVKFTLKKKRLGHGWQYDSNRMKSSTQHNPTWFKSGEVINPT